jgi:DNA-binding Lrp family transcriptional regulator
MKRSRPGVPEQMKFDDLEKRLIIELQKNGRVSYARLAKLVGINVSTAKKRVERLLSTNTIMIRAARNPLEMGHFASAFISIDVDLSKIDDVCSRLVKNYYVGLIATTFGQFDILIIASYPSWEMLHHFINYELSRMDGVCRIEPFFIKESRKSYKNEYALKRVEPVQSPIDETNHRLIEELAKNGRSSCAGMAKVLGISKSMVSRRLSSLIKNNIISIKALPNPSALGYLLDAFIFIKAEPAIVKDLCVRLAGYTEVYLIATLINGYELFVGVNFPNPESLNRFIMDEIAQQSGISNINTLIRAEIKKMDYSYFQLQK